MVWNVPLPMLDIGVLRVGLDASGLGPPMLGFCPCFNYLKLDLSHCTYSFTT